MLTRLPRPFYVIQYGLKLYPGTALLEDARRSSAPVPPRNVDYDNYRIIATTDLNRVIILSQLLSRRTIRFLLRHRGHSPGRLLIRTLYTLAAFLLPLHALRVAGARRWRDNLRLMLSHYPLALLWLRGMLGRHSVASDEMAKSTG